MAATFPIPVKATVRWWEILSAALHVILDPLGVVILMTTFALIAGILEVAKRPFGRLILLVCLGVALLGIITIVYHLRKMHRWEIARIWINRLIVEGHQLAQHLAVNRPQRDVSDFPRDIPEDRETYELMADWCKRTESVLRKYLGESYATRLHLGGSTQQDERSMTIWKMRHRLETLATFLQELKP